jgi:hypothetical protein
MNRRTFLGAAAAPAGLGTFEGYGKIAIKSLRYQNRIPTGRRQTHPPDCRPFINSKSANSLIYQPWHHEDHPATYIYSALLFSLKSPTSFNKLLTSPDNALEKSSKLQSQLHSDIGIKTTYYPARLKPTCSLAAPCAA